MDLKTYLINYKNKSIKTAILQFSGETGIGVHTLMSYIYKGRKPREDKMKIIAQCSEKRVQANDFFLPPK